MATIYISPWSPQPGTDPLHRSHRNRSIKIARLKKSEGRLVKVTHKEGAKVEEERPIEESAKETAV